MLTTLVNVGSASILEDCLPIQANGHENNSLAVTKVTAVSHQPLTSVALVSPADGCSMAKPGNTPLNVPFVSLQCTDYQ